MNALLTLNVFAEVLPAALVAIGLFGGVLALPLWTGHRSADSTDETRAPPRAAA